MTPLIDPTVPSAAADWLDEHRWLRSAGNGRTTGCMHTALLRPCSTPGDNVIWHMLEQRRGYSETWNDSPHTNKRKVLDRLRTTPEPDGAEMAAMFGPQWMAVRDLVRRVAVLSAGQATRLAAAWHAARAAASDSATAAARDAARAAARAAARDAARDAATAAASDSARAAARDSAWPAAADAASALAIRDLIGATFTADHYRTLTAPWAAVIGPVHPDDAKDGLL